MILNFIATGLLGLIDWLTAFLPLGSSWTPDTSAVQSWIGSLYGLDAYFPITEALICVGIALLIQNAVIPFHIAVWIWKRFRG